MQEIIMIIKEQNVEWTILLHFWGTITKFKFPIGLLKIRLVFKYCDVSMGYLWSDLFITAEYHME